MPILGVTWTDLYRRTRVQEAVFETLTKQYELAKVEEARETPSVKVLDVADVPEKKSFPPRLIMIVVGTIFAFAMGGVWVLAQALAGAKWIRKIRERCWFQNIADTIRRKLKWKVRYHPLEKEGVLGPRISHED